jgi:hypothetical protein
MPYSAVTQPWPLPRNQPGRLVSTDAVTKHLGIAERDEAGAFGLLGDIALDGHCAHLVGFTSGRPHQAITLGKSGKFY